MNEDTDKEIIRELNQTKQSNQAPKLNRKIKKKILFLMIFVCILFSPFLAVKVKEKFFTQSFNDAYYAFFLTNGQVYFGKLSENSRSEAILTDVYYLQTIPSRTISLNGGSEEPKFNLVKMGNEVHGPEDKLSIIKAQVLFYEKLKDDSAIVKSIESTKTEENL